MKFSSDISLWWLVPVLAFSFSLAYIMYWTKSDRWLNELTSWKRNLLTFLRAMSFFLTAILLLNIIFQYFTYKKEKPILFIGIDDSSSMLNYADSSSVDSLVGSLLTDARSELSDKFDIVTKTFADRPTEFSDSVQFIGNQTNLAGAFDLTRAEYYNRNLAAILLISDGNYNTGSHPIYAVDKYTTTSMFTLAVGDTVTKRDQLIKNIAHNDLAFLKNEFPVLVDVEGNHMGDARAELSIEWRGQKIASQMVKFQNQTMDYQQISFLIPATQPGIQVYTIRLEKLDNEANYENNTRTIYVEVIDSRSKIVLLSVAPHPDIAALKSVWDKDPNLEVNFYNVSDWDGNLTDVDLIVWHEPGMIIPANVRDKILKNSVSKLFIIGLQSEANVIRQMNLGIEIPANKQVDDYEAKINKGFNLFEYSQELQNTMEHFPPLKARYGNVQIPKDATIFSYQRIGPVVKNDPLLFFASNRQTENPYKYGVVVGEGLWRWKLAEYAHTKQFKSFDELFSKVGQYLMVKKNTEPFRIHFPQNLNPNEPISVKASLFNAALEPIISSKIQFVLTDENQKESKYQFGVNEQAYHLDLGKLPAGKYSWIAHTSISGKYHQKKGEFVVKPSFLEQTEGKANHTVLRQIATSGQGTFHLLENYRQTVEELKKRTDFNSINYQETSFKELIEYFILFVLLVLTLSSEWFLRRYWGSY